MKKLHKKNAIQQFKKCYSTMGEPCWDVSHASNNAIQQILANNVGTFSHASKNAI